MRLYQTPVMVWKDSAMEYRATTMLTPRRVGDLLNMAGDIVRSSATAFHNRGAIGHHVQVRVRLGQCCIGMVNVDADSGAILGAWLANAPFGFREVSYGHWRRVIRRQLAWATADA